MTGGLASVRRLFRCALGLGVVLGLSACASSGVSLGVSLPIGPNVGVGVGVSSDGRVGASVGVGVGRAGVSVGTSGRLPSAAEGSDTEDVRTNPTR